VVVHLSPTPTLISHLPCPFSFQPLPYWLYHHSISQVLHHPPYRFLLHKPRLATLNGQINSLHKRSWEQAQFANTAQIPHTNLIHISPLNTPDHCRLRNFETWPLELIRMTSLSQTPRLVPLLKTISFPSQMARQVDLDEEVIIWKWPLGGSTKNIAASRYEIYFKCLAQAHHPGIPHQECCEEACQPGAWPFEELCLSVCRCDTCCP